MQDIFIISIIMAVPITGILSATFLKYKKLELQQSKDNGHTAKALEQLTHMVNKLAKENTELRQRVENLETIVTLGDISADLRQVKRSSNEAHRELPPANQDNMLNSEIAQIIADHKKFR
ncbi:hypothetical protein [Rhodoflexus sp.]